MQSYIVRVLYTVTLSNVNVCITYTRTHGAYMYYDDLMIGEIH